MKSKSKISQARIKLLLDRPVAQLEHDVSLEHLTDDRFRSAVDFVRACEKVGVWRLQQGELTEDAGFEASELAFELAKTIFTLVQNGDLMLARRLPGICDMFQGALKVYGTKLAGSIKKRLSIQQLLQKHKARELIEMLTALYPNWHLQMLPIYHPKLRILPEPERHEILLRKRRKIDGYSEESLRKLLLKMERCFGWHQDEPIEEWRKHSMAQIIENVVAIREAENENINLFVEHLWQGHLWGLYKQTFMKCDWHGRKDLPERNNRRAWMKIVMPFLRRVTKDDAMKLSIFERLIAARKAVYVGDNSPDTRLAADKTDYVWNQVRTRIAQAWKTMANRARKRNSKKPA